MAATVAVTVTATAALTVAAAVTVRTELALVITRLEYHKLLTQLASFYLLYLLSSLTPHHSFIHSFINNT